MPPHCIRDDNGHEGTLFTVIPSEARNPSWHNTSIPMQVNAKLMMTQGCPHCIRDDNGHEGTLFTVIPSEAEKCQLAQHINTYAG